jgi:hypothetical protein
LAGSHRLTASRTELPIGRGLVGHHAHVSADPELTLVAARLAVNRQRTEDLPGIAADALMRGVDSPSLRLLAGTPTTEVRDSRDLFWMAMDELSIERPTDEVALWAIALALARAIVDGEVHPHTGASRIWWDVYEPLGQPTELAVFVGLASEWEDHEEHRPDYEREIREEAEHLLATRS